MKILRGIRELKQVPLNPVVTIGNFDGVHLGHQEIIRLAKEKAIARSGEVVVYTFDPHPRVVLRPELKVDLLTTADEKLELLERFGVGATIVEPFSREFSSMEAGDFFEKVLLQRLQAQAIVVGYDFGFGKDRQGSDHLLQTLCQKANVELTRVPPFQHGELGTISSSKIREALLKSEIERANQFLGYSFFYRGLVKRGAGRGKQIGFPTANLQMDSKVQLPFGVYVTQTRVKDRQFSSVTNIGTRPTFDSDSGPLVETHLLDVDSDLYGHSVEVQFLKKIRPEKKFPGIQELKEQIQKDIEFVRSF